VTFPSPGTAWGVPTSDWHLDSQDLDLTMLTTPAGPHAASAPVRSREVKAYLRTRHPWLRDLWQAHPQADRMYRYLTEGADVDGVPVRVEELTGEPGDAVIMHPRLLHVVAPNSLDTPRLMLLQFLHRQP
jgi:hypothetical protein